MKSVGGVMRHSSAGLELLEWLLDYEIRAAARYRRFATLVMIGSGNGPVNIRELLIDSVRDSDEYFELDSSSAVLMGETDGADALVAVHRYKARCDDDVDLRFSVASYPGDGRGVGELVSAAQRRLNQARGRHRGAIVTSG